MSTGILRKRNNVAPTNFDELLIVGYQSHIFRDDEKALFIDQGKHLIPWMGDEALRIDRYDVRATLSDLKPYEAPPGGYENRLDYLSPAEQKAEQLCEEERYYSLYHNEIEEEVYQEELQKRQKPGYGQVGFSYDGAPPSTGGDDQPVQPHGPEEEETEDDPFQPMPNFEIPADIEVPDTMKLNAIIEKTARFIAEQGAQMEILIKAKQSNNPQFDFLNLRGHLNNYYKFILAAMKERRYPERPVEVEKKKSKASHSNGNGEATSVVDKPILTPLRYVPSADCAYTQLISKIKGTPIAELSPKTPDPTMTTEDPVVNVKPAAVTPTIPQKPMVEFKQKANSVEIKKISTGLMLAQSYNSDSEDDEGSGKEDDAKEGGEKGKENGPGENHRLFDLPVPPEDLKTIVDKTAAYVAKNGKDFEDILRTKNDPRFSFLDESSVYHRYYIYKVTGTIYLPATTTTSPIKAPKEQGGSGNGTQESHKIKKEPVVVQPVSFTIKATKKDDHSANLQSNSGVKLTESDSEKEEDGKETKKESAEVIKLDDDDDDEVDDESLSVADLLEREEKKELRRVEEQIKDKLAARAREMCGLLSKEKQLQIERKKKAMAFLSQIKSNGGVTGSPGSSTKSDRVEKGPVGATEDARLNDEKRNRSRSRSRRSSRSPTSYHSERNRRKSRSRSPSSRPKSKRKRRSGDRERRHKRKKSKSRSRRSSSSGSDLSRSSRDKHDDDKKGSRERYKSRERR